MDSLFQQTKIVFIVGTLSQGGAERQLFYMLRTLREQGNTPTVLCLTEGEFWEPRIRALGIPVLWVGQSGSRLTRLRKIIGEVRRLAPDIVQSSHFYTNLYAAIAGRVAGASSVGAMRNDCISEVRATGRVLGMASLKSPALLAGNSPGGIRAALSLGVAEERLFFLPNVVDTSLFPPSRREPREPVVILAAGRLVEQKRLDRFVAAVARLRQHRGGAVKGLIVGEGELLPALKAQAKSLGLDQDGLEFRGAVTDMPAVYHEADLFALTSDWEGTPNVVLEAMASSLPVVSTNAGGVAELIEHGCSGFIIDSDDDGQWFDCLARLAGDQALRTAIGQRARLDVENRFALARLAANLEALYASALARRRQC